VLAIKPYAGQVRTVRVATVACIWRTRKKDRAARVPSRNARKLATHRLLTYFEFLQHIINLIHCSKKHC
jgi:hypothetical protein